MAPPEPPEEPERPSAADRLDELRAQLRATREAAERLAREEPPPSGEAEQPPRVPPQGWATPQREGEPSAHDELAALIALLQALRDLVPAELQHQVTEVIRQVLLLLRGLIDVMLERLEAAERPPGAEPEAQVEDIPIA